MLQVGFPGVDRPAMGLSVIPSLRGAAWSAATGAVGRGQSEGATRPGVGGHDGHDPRPAAIVGDHALRRFRQRMCPSRSP
jgi:hypothetical protein